MSNQTSFTANPDASNSTENLIKALSTRELLFCNALLEGKSIKDSALEASYAPKSAGKQGNKLLKRPNVKAYLENKREELGRKLDFSREELVHEAGTIITDKEERTSDRIRCIEAVSKLKGYWNEGGTTNSTQDKLISLLGKAMGALGERQEAQRIDVTPKPLVIDSK